MVKSELVRVPVTVSSQVIVVLSEFFLVLSFAQVVSDVCTNVIPVTFPSASSTFVALSGEIIPLATMISELAGPGLYLA